MMTMIRSSSAICPIRSALSPLGKRNIFQAIDDSYNLRRLQELIQFPKSVYERQNGNTVLHRLAGADLPHGLPRPLGREPPIEFTLILLSAAHRLINEENADGETALDIALRVGFSTVVRQLLKMGAYANNPPHSQQGSPLDAAVSSTVTFDPRFNIRTQLVTARAKIDARDPNGDTPLFALVHSVEKDLNLARQNMNSLCSDVSRIHLYEKVYWLLKQGAQVEDGEKSLLVTCLKSLHPYASHSLVDKSLRPLAPLLLRYSKAFPIDERQWSVLHLAAYRQCEAVAEELIKRGVSYPQGDSGLGITPYELACLNMNRPLIQCFRPDVDVEKTIEQIDPAFFGKLATKLYKLNSKGCRLEMFTTGLPRLLSASDLSGPEMRLLSLYRNEPALVSYEHPSPMTLALKEKDEGKIMSLIRKGWNFYIEQDFITAAAKGPQSSLHMQFNNAFLEAIREMKNGRDFSRRIITAFNNSEASGVTLSSEFDSCLASLDTHSEVFGKYIFLLFDMGLSPELYFKQSGYSLKESIRYAYNQSFNDKHGWYQYPSYPVMCQIAAHAMDRGWISGDTF